MHDDFQGWIESLRMNIQNIGHIINEQQKMLAVEKETKLAELKYFLQKEAEQKNETPPNVMLAFLLAPLRRTYNVDQLAKVKWQLHELEQTIATIDDLPYLWDQ